MALTKKQRAELRMKFGGRCAYCGCELGEKWHADHVKPVIRFDGNMLHQERDDISN
ncbi:TPA: HNH endonuclease, partial [Shigella sonnei]|nr:HNH endonuclease [Shigella sonnei]